MIDTRSLSRQLVILTALLAVLGGCGPRASEPAARGHFPSQRDLENLTYRSGFTRTGRVQLIHGAYQEPIRGSSQTLMVTLSPSLRLLGALNEHQDGAAVILRTVAGTVQRGEFYDLAAVVKTDTVAQNVAIASLGDRIKVRSVMLDNSRIIIDMLTHGPKDRISRPTLLVRRTYVLRGEKLLLQTSEPLEE